jgi:hypothetical protein
MPVILLVSPSARTPSTSPAISSGIPAKRTMVEPSSGKPAISYAMRARRTPEAGIMNSCSVPGSGNIQSRLQVIRIRRSFTGDTEFLLRTVIRGGHVVVRAGPGRRGTCSTRPVTPRAGLGGQDTALGRRPARRQRHGRLPGTAPVRPHHSAEPSGYVAASGRRGRRACGLQQRTGPIPHAGKACLSRTAISFSTSDLGRGWPVLKRRAPDEVG